MYRQVSGNDIKDGQRTACSRYRSRATCKMNFFCWVTAKGRSVCGMPLTP